MLSFEEIAYLDDFLFEIFKDKYNAFDYENIDEEETEKLYFCEAENSIKAVPFVIQKLIENNFDFTKKLAGEYRLKAFKEFSENFTITQKEFTDIFEKAREERVRKFYASPKVKKLLSEVKGELPIISSRVYNISLGLHTKANGQELTLKEYSQLVNEDYETNLMILESAKKLVEKKLTRRLKKEKI